MSSVEVIDEVGGVAAGQAGQVTREELYAEVWRLPMTKVAERHGVSSSFMARVCTHMNVPRPPRGHWAKLEHGKPSPQPALPEAGPGDLQVWRRGDVAGAIPYPLPKAPASRPIRLEQLRVPRSRQHPLITGARELFEQGRVIDEGFLKPGRKRLVDIVVTKGKLESALKTANRLFLKLEAAGYRVMFAPSDRIYARTAVDEHEQPPKRRTYRYTALWVPSKPTVVFVGTVAIGLTLFEMTEELEARYVDGEYIPVSRLPPQKHRQLHPTVNWTTRKDFATGRLCLQAFSPYPLADWTRCWRESKGNRLEDQLDEIVQQLADAAPVISRLVEEGEERQRIRQLEWEEEHRRFLIKEELRRQAKAREEARSDLLKVIGQWDELRRIHAFFRDAEVAAAEQSGEERAKVMEKLAQARELIGEVDALKALIAWKGPLER